MLSYLTLVGLHFAICLSPSTVSFSRLEWAILVFFLGRIFMEVDQFISAKKAGVKARKMLNKESDEPNNEGSEENETSNDNIWPEKFTRYFSDRWNVLDCIIDLFYLISFILRILTSRNSTDVADNRLLAVSEYFYGFIAMFLTIRAFGQVMECMQGLGAIQIALFFFIWDVIVIFWQFLATVLAFWMAMTKVFVAEKTYTSGKDSAEDLACSDSGIICWWNMATHLCWSLLSLADLDKLNSVDNPSISLIYLLYSFFLITGVILLVNMMIALLTNTYQRVQDNSLQEWSFRRATTVRTYSTYHPIPVPFNLLTVPLMLLWRTQFDTPALDEEVRSRALDKLVVKLQRIYFEKYGYKFPLTEEKKIDHLVQENEGSRKMINQIAQQVFRPRGNKKEQLAFGERAWYDSPGIAVDGCLLTYMGPDFCVICREGRPKHIHSAKFKSPFTPKTPRFEVLIQETGEKRIIGLGVVGESYDCHSMPGWYDGTVGYHADDGKIFETGFSELGREVEGAMAYRGDLLACEVDFNGVFEDKKISVSFFLNGREVNSSSMKYTSGKQLFPLVALGFKGITVLTKMCHRDRDCFSRVTNEDLQEQLDEQRRIMSELRNLALRLEKKEEPFDRKLN
ncbi:uncharacterized protein LOC111329137 isoform X1 [Stylophora pistillata]|uniref:uncharacterized protein LOC111329137 isoform X1 n=1 Tax=Stylophora pistillata TaxID=50429 RepID=UPI000C057BD2|nr:uncharacterized protein LOC111329137 isoform X1 [Stylophora pistillata]